MNEERPDLTKILLRVFRHNRGKALKTLLRTSRLQFSMFRAERRRRAARKREHLPVPIAIAISPTSRCNLSCNGCYSRFHPQDNEITPEVIDRLVGDAFDRGVFMFVITGGEPYIIPEMLDIYEKHRGALFLTVSNGTLLGEETVRRIRRSGNVLPVVSLEGSREMTDARRGDGVYEQARRCMSILRDHDMLFGFSVVVTGTTVSMIDDGSFLEGMKEAGCVIGFFNDFIPITPEDEDDLPTPADLARFRERLNVARAREPMILLHLPDDEYDERGRCIAVDRGTMHVNSRGFVEACPFAPFALENVKECSFEDLLRSPFLEAIRNHPTALQRGDAGCALSSNKCVLEEISRATCARPTRAGHCT